MAKNGGTGVWRKHRPRVAPDVVVRGHSPNHYDYSPRYLIIVLHSTEGWNYEGSADLVGLRDFFSQWSTQAAAHVCTDDDGMSARTVADRYVAWHCSGLNDVSLGIEQIGFAAQQRWSRKELKETARWIAQWSHEHDIPIRRGIVRHGRVVQTGIVTHKELGSAGGGHVDPGSGYPVERVLKYARRYKRLRYGLGHRRKTR